MEARGQNSEQTDRRKHVRWSVYSFLHATATVSDCMSIDQIVKKQAGRCWIGLLADISHKGAQVVLPYDCEKYLRQGQHIAMLIKTSLENMNVGVTAQVKSIAVGQNQNNVRIGVEFAQLESDTRAKDTISRICEYGRKLQAVEKNVRGADCCRDARGSALHRSNWPARRG